MNHKDHESGNAAQLERNGAAIREDMDRTLHALEDRFSPGQLLDRSMHYLQEHGTQMLNELDSTVRRHPIPVALAAGGLLWFIGSMLGSRRDTNVVSRSAAKLSAATSKLRKGSVQSRLQHTGEQVSETVRGQPLAFGALAIAAGALLGALLPTSGHEQRTLSSRDRGTRDPSADRPASDEAERMRASNHEPPQGPRH